MQIVGTETVFEKKNVIALGTFDGLHRAHYRIIQLTKQIAQQRGMGSMVYTFASLPSARFGGESQLLFTPAEKTRALDEAEIDYLQMQPFDEKVACQSREAFAEYLRTTLQAGVLVAGFDFRFGAGAAGDAEFLQQYGKAHGIEVIILQRMDDAQEPISSTRIRMAVRSGDLQTAERLLGRPYGLCGEVCHGREVGRTIGFPTANISVPHDKILPPRGVYITRVTLDGKVYGGITNIGSRPTLQNGEDVSIETNILGLQQEIYGKQIQIELLKFVRPEQTFADLDALRKAIERDKSTAAIFFEKENKKPL